MMWSQFRVDTSDKNGASDFLDKFCERHEGKYCFTLEKAQETSKLHLQGWTYHNASDNTYRKHMAVCYKEYGVKQKCFTRIKNPETYVAYILRNDLKGHVDYSGVVTNYTLDEFERLVKDLTPFVDKPAVTRGAKPQFSNEVINTFVKHGVKDGVIQYHELPFLYLRHCPKRINKTLMYDNVMGLTVQLERMFPHEKNTRAQYHLCDGFAEADAKNQVFRMTYSNEYWKNLSKELVT